MMVEDSQSNEYPTEKLFRAAGGRGLALVVPAEVLSALGWREGDELFFHLTEDATDGRMGALVLKKSEASEEETFFTLVRWLWVFLREVWPFKLLVKEGKNEK